MSGSFQQDQRVSAVDQAKQVIIWIPYKVTDTSLDPQIATLKASGADIFLDVTTPKFAVMAIKRTTEIGWKPEHILSNVSKSTTAVMQPAGVQNSEGILSAAYMAEFDDPSAANSPAYRDWAAFMDPICQEQARAA